MRMWPRTHKAQQRNLLPLVSRARGAVSPPARVPQGYSSAKRAVAGLPERNCATISGISRSQVSWPLSEY